MNKKQITGPLRIAIGFIVTWAVTKGYVPESLATQIVSGVVLFALLVWSFMDNTITAMLNTVVEDPDVEEVVVTPPLKYVSPSPKVKTKEKLVPLGAKA